MVEYHSRGAKARALVLATVEGRKLALGNLKPMQREGIALGASVGQVAELADHSKTPLCVAVGGQAAGIVAVPNANHAFTASWPDPNNFLTIFH